jgi:hypothetical protein
VIKFMVVLYRRQDLNEGEFQAYPREVHGPMAEAVPNLLHYTDRETMEAAWASPEARPRRRTSPNSPISREAPGRWWASSSAGSLKGRSYGSFRDSTPTCRPT